MNGDVKTYCITFYSQGVNVEAFTQYLYDSADIVAFWNYIPLVYCVKSHLSATELTAKLRPFFPAPVQHPVGNFMIAEVNAGNLNGVLPKEAWDWFYLPHHQKSHPPTFPRGSFSEGLLGGAVYDLGLLPPPQKK